MILSTYFVSHSFYEVAVVRAGKLSVYIKAAGGVELNRIQLKAVCDHSARSLTYYMMPK